MHSSTTWSLAVTKRRPIHLRILMRQAPKRLITGHNFQHPRLHRAELRQALTQSVRLWSKHNNQLRQTRLSDSNRRAKKWKQILAANSAGIGRKVTRSGSRAAWPSTRSCSTARSHPRFTSARIRVARASIRTGRTTYASIKLRRTTGRPAKRARRGGRASGRRWRPRRSRGMTAYNFANTAGIWVYFDGILVLASWTCINHDTTLHGGRR